jgi:hypothetical protein
LPGNKENINNDVNRHFNSYKEMKETLTKEEYEQRLKNLKKTNDVAVYSDFHSKRVKQKNGYWVKTFDSNNKLIGKKKWKISNENTQRQIIHEYNRKLTKKEFENNKIILKEMGYDIPKHTQYGEMNFKHPFTYEIGLRYFSEDDPKHIKEKIIMITNSEPMTRNELDRSVKKYAKDKYKINNLKSFTVKKLHLQKSFNYDEMTRSLQNNAANKSSVKSKRRDSRSK